MRPPGFAIIAVVVAPSEIEGITSALGEVSSHRTRAGARHLMNMPVVRSIAEDPRLLAVAQTFLEAQAIPFRATLFDKSVDSNWLVTWHQDRALPMGGRVESVGWGPWSLKDAVHYANAPVEALERIVALRLSLDDSRRDNGPLRVLPGTESLGLLTDAQIATLVQDIPPVDCCVDAGGLVVMRPLVVHASSKAVSDDRRRVLQVEYADSLDIAPGLQLAVV